MPHLILETGGAARVEVRSEDGAMFQPAGAIMDRGVGAWPELPGSYAGHFVTEGTAVLDVPEGRYRITVARGLEHERAELTVTLGSRSERFRLVPRRWTELAGWWSADMHLHRPFEDVVTLLPAEGLDLGVVITAWNDHPMPSAIPASGIAEGPGALATLHNAEDERGGGALIMHARDAAGVADVAGLGPWYPPGATLAGPARAGGWVDCEKPTWWETPVTGALVGFDSMGVLNNHYTSQGINANEAWGRPRDIAAHPGPQGFSDYCLELYYRYLNLGHRLTASAGTASGVLPSPPGYNRVYVRSTGPLSVPAFYRSLRAGHSFVTNGPLLQLDVGGFVPGQTIAPGRSRISARAEAAEPVDRIEIVADGEVIVQERGDRLETEVDLAGRHWLIARCYLRVAPAERNVRLAHTSPLYIDGTVSRALADRRFFARWIDELIEQTCDRPDRFATAAEQREQLHLYRVARRLYSGEDHL